jgi:hypothetical protein
MKQVRRLIIALSAFIGIWVLVSFTGAMVDSANAGFWSDSLMWSLLSSLIVMPALVMVNHASTQASRKTAQQQAQTPEPEPEQEPFVQEDSDETHTLWPEPEQEAEWPSEEQTPEQDRVRA